MALPRLLTRAGPDALACAGLLLVACALAGLLTRTDVDPDRSYHYALSRVVAEQGVPRTLPQVTGIGWDKAFFDKEFLWHQLTGLGYHHVNWDVVATDWDVATTPAEIRDTIVKAFKPGLVILMHDGAIDSAAGAADEVALPQVIERGRAAGYCFGQLNPEGKVVPARYHSSHRPVPEVINPVPYLPLESYSRGKVPPAPYVVVDPAKQL